MSLQQIEHARDHKGAAPPWKATKTRSSTAYEQGDLLLGHPDLAHTKRVANRDYTSHGARQHHGQRDSEGERGG
jgi:hypothetical protein